MDKKESLENIDNEIGETKSTHFIILAFSINETKKISAPTHA